jgi:hypothetical protein
MKIMCKWCNPVYKPESEPKTMPKPIFKDSNEGICPQCGAKMVSEKIVWDRDAYSNCSKCDYYELIYVGAMVDGPDVFD